MLKHTKPAPRPREPTAEELKASIAAVHARVARLNEITRLASQLDGAELEGLIVLAEAALRDRRALDGLDAATADRGICFMLPDGVW